MFPPQNVLLYWEYRQIALISILLALPHRLSCCFIRFDNTISLPVKSNSYQLGKCSWLRAKVEANCVFRVIKEEYIVSNENKRYKLIRARYLLPMGAESGLPERVEDGYVLTDGGTIREIGVFSEEVASKILSECGSELEILGADEGKQSIPCHPGVLLPGFIKAHGHDHESPIIGIAKDVPLTPWLDRAVNLFTGFMDEHRSELEEIFGCSPNLVTYLKARVDDISYGITSSVVHHCNHNKYRVDEIAKANRAAGTTMFIAVGSQDRHYDERLLDSDPKIALDRLYRYVKNHGDIPRVTIIPGPDQLFSNGPQMLKALKAWAKEHGTLFHIHSSEEPNTTRWFIETYGMTPIEYASSIGILDENTLLAHQVNCSENDLKLIRDSGAMVVHNPLANTILGSGMPPVMKMLEMGIPVAISTDGSGSADNQNIISAVRLASQYQKAFHQDATLLPAKQVLEMITAVPAKMLGLNAGVLAPGKDADLTLVDLTSPNLVPTRLDNVMENLVWAANGNEISQVMAGGRLLMRDGKLVTLDARRICERVQKLSELLVEYAATIKIKAQTGAPR